MTKKGFLTCCGFVFVLLYSCSTVPETDSGCKSHYTFRNGVPCETFKQEHLSESFLDVTFSPKPRASGENRFWVLAWNGIDIILPCIAYEHVYLFKGSDGEYNFRLEAGGYFQISLFANKNDRYEDVFSVYNLHDRTTETSAEGIAATKAMFGGPIRHSELMMRAYASTTKDITCCLEKAEEERGTVVALIMKSIDRPDIVAAYKGVGRHDGWITESEADGRMEYALNIVAGREAPSVFQVIYEMPAQAPWRPVPFLVGNVDRRAAAPGPGWVAALNRALRENSNEAWRGYLGAARQAGLSPKSIQIVEAMLPLPEGE